MAPNYHLATALLLVVSLLFSLSNSALVKEQRLILKYHNGALLKGNIAVNLIWYGRFTPIQRSIIVDFINSLSGPGQPQPSASSWWGTTAKYSARTASRPSSSLTITHQVLHEEYNLGKLLRSTHLLALASKVNPAGNNSTINVVLTASDVAVDGFCTSRCGTHGALRGGGGAYVWVGNPESQCPGYCAWPFHQPPYGPQSPPLVAPNGDVGVDGMVITLASLLANTVTNPFRGGYFQGPVTAPLEAASACTGMFGPGSYPGYPGQLLTDKVTGASFNAYGSHGRKFLLPAMWDPQTSACKTLV